MNFKKAIYVKKLISKLRNLLRTEFLKGKICWKMNFKKANYVKKLISKLRNLLRTEFLTGKNC